MKNLPFNSFIGKAAHAFYTAAANPPPAQNFTKLLGQTLKGYQNTAGGFYDLNKQYGPKYQSLTNQLAALGLFGDRTTPGSLGLTTAANRFTRASDLNDVGRMGPAATIARLRSNPFLANALTNLSGRTADSPILRTLNSQANSALAQGGRLSPADTRNLDQQSNAAFAQRGNVMGNQAIGAQLLGRDSAQRSRMAAAQQFGGAVQNLNNQQAGVVNNAANTFYQTLGDPFQEILGRTGGVNGGLQIGGGGGGIGPSSSIFNMNNPAAADIMNTNYNAQASSNIANAQAQNSTTNAAIGLIGSLLLSDKKLKRKIRREGTTRSGIPIKSFEYRRSKKDELRIKKPTPRFVGVIAQDVAKIAPHAVHTMPSGHKAVNMRAIDAPFYQVRSKKAEGRRLPQRSLGELLAA